MSKQFQALLLHQLPKLRAYALMLTRHGADADDLLQSASLRILRFEKHFAAGTNFSAWSSRVLRNCYLSDCRKNHRRTVNIDELPEALLGRSGNQEERVLAKEIVQAMGKLSAPAREVLALVCGSGLTYHQVAEVMSCNVGTVKSRLWRAKYGMKVLLDGSYGEARQKHLPDISDVDAAPILKQKRPSARKSRANYPLDANLESPGVHMPIRDLPVHGHTTHSWAAVIPTRLMASTWNVPPSPPEVLHWTPSRPKNVSMHLAA